MLAILYTAVGMLSYLLITGPRATTAGMVTFGILFGVFGILMDVYVFTSF
jgi:hypothetical protein